MLVIETKDGGIVIEKVGSKNRRSIELTLFGSWSYTAFFSAGFDGGNALTWFKGDISFFQGKHILRDSGGNIKMQN